jgi:hypothetical protein
MKKLEKAHVRHSFTVGWNLLWHKIEDCQRGEKEAPSDRGTGADGGIRHIFSTNRCSGEIL